MMRLSCFPIVLIALATACAQPESKPDAAAAAPVVDTAAIKEQTHQAYVNAINSNNLDSLLGMLTEDVVFMAGHTAPVIGKASVGAWVSGYLKAYKTYWDKPQQEFKVAGDWAFERYSYNSVDTPVAGGAPVKDSGWGLVIYHRDSDGKWRVSRDAWGTDQPLPTR